MIYFYARHIESCDFSRVGRITHAVFCLHHFLPYVGNIGTIGTNGIANGTIGKTLNGICLPMVPFLPFCTLCCVLHKHAHTSQNRSPEHTFIVLVFLLLSCLSRISLSLSFLLILFCNLCFKYMKSKSEAKSI